MNITKYRTTVHDYIVIDELNNENDIKELLDRKEGIGADYLIMLSKCPYYDAEVNIYSSDGRTFDNGAMLVVGYILYSRNNEGNHFIVTCNNEGYELFICDNIITLMRQNPLIIKKCYFAKVDRYVYKIENKNYMLNNDKRDNIISIKLLGNNKFELIGDNITSSDYLNAYVLLKHKGIYRGTCYSDNMLFYSTFLHNIFITSKVSKIYDGNIKKTG